MSLIQSLKSKILETKNDLSDSLNSNILGKNESESIDYGFDILFRYKFNWSKIHKENEYLSKNIQKSELLLLKISSTTRDMHDKLSQLQDQLSNLNQVAAEVRTINSVIDGLNTTCCEVEEGLVLLEDANENEELRTKKEQQQNQLAFFALQKEQQLIHDHTRLEEDHKEKVRQLEIKNASILEERQRVFSEAHNQIMQDFKNTGVLEKRQDVIQITNVDLSQVLIEDDPTVLEEFLQDKNDIPPN